MTKRTYIHCTDCKVRTSKKIESKFLCYCDDCDSPLCYSCMKMGFRIDRHKASCRACTDKNSTEYTNGLIAAMERMSNEQVDSEERSQDWLMGFEKGLKER